MASEHTAELARGYELPPQAAGESDTDFRHRIAGSLREMGHVIEAHEAQQNARWDSEGDSGAAVVDGLVGAMAQALNGNPYGGMGPDGNPYPGRGVSQVGTDIVAGVWVRDAPRREAANKAFLTLLGLVGGDPSKLC